MGEQWRGLGEFHRALRAVSPVPARLVLPYPRPVEAQAVPSTRCQQRPAREHVRDRSSAQAGKPAGSTFSSNLNADPSRPRTGATLLDFGRASRHHSRTKPHSRVMASAGEDRRTGQRCWLAVTRGHASSFPSRNASRPPQRFPTLSPRFPRFHDSPPPVRGRYLPRRDACAQTPPPLPSCASREPTSVNR